MATFKIILYTSKKLKSENHPVVLRITDERRRKYYVVKSTSGRKLDMSCKHDEWKETENRYDVNKVKSAIEKNAILAEVERTVEKILFRFEYENIPFTFQAFEREYLRKAKKVTVISFFSDHIKLLEDSGRIGYSTIFKHTRNSVKQHLKDSSTFRDIDYSWLKNYTAYLESQQLKPNSIFVYLRTLRTLFNEGIKQGFIQESDYPFKSRLNPNGYSISQYNSPTHKRALSEGDIIKIFGYMPKEGTPEFHAKNYFAISFYGLGINFTDLACLRWSDINNNRIQYVRQKTGGVFSIGIIEPLAEILNWYKVNYPGSKYIIPVLPNDEIEPKTKYWKIKSALRRTNKNLKNIAEKLKLSDTEITSYWARHSWASIAYSQNQPMSLIKEGLGHRTEEQTSVYLKGFGNTAVDKANQKLYDRLKKISRKNKKNAKS